MSDWALYFKYWGKADRDDPTNKYHRLPYHCLDVAAVGKVLLERHPFMIKILSQISGIEEKALSSLLILFLVLHDLGKFSESFQYVVPDLLKKMQGKETSLKQPYSKKDFCHGAIGFLLWKEELFQRFFESIIAKFSDDRDSWWDLLNWFMEPSSGHHGLPVKHSNRPLCNFYSENDIQAAFEFVKDIIDLFSIKNSFPSDLVNEYPCLYEKLTNASWAFAGFIVLCDWIGSGNTFKPQSQVQPLTQYWKNTALRKAEIAIEHAGVLPCRTNRQLDPLSELLDLPENARLTPLQELCSKVPILEKPQLFIIEDQTGSGKTEASLILLNRIMSQGQISGFYLALPTMATADGIFPRVQKAYQNLYDADEKPSLILSHSSAKLSDRFTETIISAEDAVSEQKYGDDARSRCQAWLADNRKKALLAHAGVGTVDQTFLAVLKTKYQSLRLIGLIGKVLVIDEAHAYDAYMGKELEVLLQVHAALGGSAIIMSATLPFSTRQKLVNAFLKGTESEKQQLQRKKTYPLLTHIAEGHKKELSFPCKIKKSRKDVYLEFLNAEKDVERIIEKSLEQNHCVCWLRNSVKDARDTYLNLKNKNFKIDLFHARFTIADRHKIQDKILRSFDKDSTHEQRAGRLVIATQVVEQSLDLDFDVMISDLAPIDLILQRAGRLHRHIRDKFGNPKTEGNDQRGKATLYVYSQEYTDNPKEDWFSSFFPNSKKVYENHARLWLGLKQLNRLPRHKIPENPRKLIENTYDHEAKIPPALSKWEINADGNAHSQRTMGTFNTINFDNGYTMDDQQWPEDMKMPTRLGDETIMLTLGKWKEGKLSPFNSVENRPWQNSEIRVPEKSVAKIPVFDGKLHDAYEKIKPTLPNQGKWINLLPMTWDNRDQLWEGEIIDGRDQKSKVYYHNKLGLMYAYEIESIQTDEQLETEELI